MPRPTPPAARVAYSYLRFSSRKQEKGGSVQRQADLSKAWCRRRKVPLDESLRLDDLGVSAFRGDNVREGYLAGFLEACRMGRVPRGSYLLVESLDRLSRDMIRPALQLFLQIQDYGITIVTFQPDREYPPEQTDALALIEPLLIFARAHEESQRKSQLRKEAWKQGRDAARVGGQVAAGCPAWLVRTPDGFVVQEERAAIVRRIYRECLGGLGAHCITQGLIRDEVPAMGRTGKWVMGYVEKLLRWPAVVGTYQPLKMVGKRREPDGPPLAGYYPEIISEKEWNAAQRALRGRSDGRGAGRHGTEEANLFTHIGWCAHTQARLQVMATHVRGKRDAYICPAVAGGIKVRRYGTAYEPFEAAVLSLLRELRPADIATDEAHANGRETEIARLAGRLLDIDTRLERTKAKARTTEDFDAFLDLIQDLQTERRQVSAQLTELRRDEASVPSADLGEAQSLIDMLAQATPEQREELRRRLKARIRQLIEAVWILAVPRGRGRLIAVQLFFVNGRRRDYLIWHMPGKASGAARTEGSCHVCSLAALAIPGERDLRQQENALALVKVLEEADLEELRTRLQEAAARR